MTLFAYLRRVLDARSVEPERLSAAARLQRLDELRRLLASDLAAHRIEKGHA